METIMRLCRALVRVACFHYHFVRFKILRLLRIKGRSAWISAPANLAHFAEGDHPECPERITAIEKALRDSHVWRFLQKITAPEVSDIQLARVHGRTYLTDLENKIPASGSIKIDNDTYLNRDTLNAARFGAGAAVKAVDMVMRKQAKNAFCAIRPPGHHASADKASGFCFINNIAVAAMHAIAEYRLERVAIVDFDVHHGDGTENIFRDEPRILFLSSFEYPLYPVLDLANYPECPPNAVRSPMPAGIGGEAFRQIIREQWLPRLDAFRPQMIMCSAGFDAHHCDPLGGLNLTEADFEWLTKKMMAVANRYASGRMVSVLEGGYDVPSLAMSVKAHLGCLVKANPFG